jgi:riboflavin biosynthesis pyrimidine reductase
MASLVLKMSVSLDGHVAPPDGSADWGEMTIAAGDLAAAVTRLKRERSGGYLLAHGGVRFARSLVATGTIDEYRLVVHPVVLGAGERIFTAPLTVEPTRTTAFSRGAVAHVFAARPGESRAHAA